MRASLLSGKYFRLFIAANEDNANPPIGAV
jgi:hypothetical protein